MRSIEYFSELITKYPFITGLMKYLLWVLVIVIIIRFLRKQLKKNVPNTTTRYKSQKGVEIVGYIFFILLTISYFTGNIKDFTLAIGLFSAGVALTLQELFLSIAGSIYIFLVKVYKPGERIEIHGIKGDVIDIDSIYTTLMEIGEWVSSDNYSGRIVKLSNSFVFKGPIYNYSRDFPFIWDEFNLPIRYGSDIELAKKILINAAKDILSDYTLTSKEKWNQVVNKYYIENALVDPTLAITLTDNWIQFNLRYIVDFKKRRVIKHTLNDRIISEIERTQGKVILASSTVEIIKFPESKIDIKKN